MFVVFQPDSNHNQSRLNSSDKTDGDQVTPEQVIRNRLLSKINRTNEQLISEQNAKQCTCVYVTRHISNSDVIFSCLWSMSDIREHLLPSNDLNTIRCCIILRLQVRVFLRTAEQME